MSQPVMVKGSRGAQSEPKPIRRSNTFDKLFGGHFVSSKGGRGGAGGLDEDHKDSKRHSAIIPSEHQLAPSSNADKIGGIFKKMFGGKKQMKTVDEHEAVEPIPAVAEPEVKVPDITASPTPAPAAA